MYKLVFALLVVVWGTTTSVVLSERTVSSHLSQNDVARLQKVFADGLSSDDLQAIYYASLNIEPTNAANRDALCKTIRTLHADSKLSDFEKDFYLIGSNKNLRCTEKLPEAVVTRSNAALKTLQATSAQEISYLVASSKLLGVQIDEASKTKIVKTLQDLLKKEDTLASLGYAFSVATELGPTAAFVAERVEDAIVQADEVDGKMLQFEGGLSITALVVNGAFQVSQAFNKPTPITADQAVKLGNYLLSRRSVQTPKGAHLLIESLKTLSSAGKIAPICIQLIGNGQLQAESPTLNIAIVDLLGKAVSPVPQNVFGKIALKKADSVLAEKVQFVSKSSDKTTFAADLGTYKPQRGIYIVDVTSDGAYKQQLQFKVLGRVKVQSLEVGIVEVDASASAKKQSVTYPNKLSEKLSADSTQKILLKAMLVDEGSAKPISVHQAFVRLYNAKRDEEIIFVAEQDSSKAYKFDLDVGMHAVDFKHISGDYEMHLIVGDAALSNSFQWHVADISLKFLQEAKDVSKQPIRAALPIIEHQFRPPEKRPARFVSDVFTGLCLFPLVLLFIFWGKLGINVSNFSFAPSTIGFHIGFGGILALFGIFWLNLNMFQTLRLLIPVAVFTFLCGNRMLRSIYTQRVSKTPSSAASTTSSSS